MTFYNLKLLILVFVSDIKQKKTGYFESTRESFNGLQ
jgi:hypothetical protein